MSPNHRRLHSDSNWQEQLKDTRQSPHLPVCEDNGTHFQECLGVFVHSTRVCQEPTTCQELWWAPGWTSELRKMDGTDAAVCAWHHREKRGVGAGPGAMGGGRSFLEEAAS